MIAGFIDTNGKEYLDFSVTTETVANARIDYGDGNNHQYYYGINLDVNDKDNNIRYLIAPNSTGDLGLKIGSFKLYASHKYFTLTLSHPSLTHTTDNQTTLDYRIGLRFKMLGGEIMQFSDSAQGQNRNLTIDFSSDVFSSDKDGIIVINNSDTGIYFRLATDPPTKAGQYSSTITFEVTSQR